ncbi:MAG: TonB family protein [Gammaproteobacteria bacterium]|nr:TonB family protein [Gammaproteobacteria bacterium]
MATATITPKDRLSFTLFLAVALHAAIILGVGFTAGLSMEESPTIEVTLAQYSDPDAPEDADFIAQSNQLGSGTEAEILELTTTQDADFQDNQLQQVITDPLAAVAPMTLEQRELLTAISSPDDNVTTQDETPLEAVESPLLAANETYDTLAREIASLEARIALEQQALAKQPRIKRLTSVSTKTADEAAYLNMWRRKVERIGNANYPDSGVFGDLRMLVVLNYDGQLRDIRILQSSGYKVLDEAALRIVRIAAPFQDFPVEMRKKYDQLEIIRTWKFSISGTTLGS